MDDQNPSDSGGETYSFPASAAQGRMFFLDQLAAGSPTYHIAQCYELRGTVDESALHQACQGLLDRHEALRTRFVIRDGTLLQMIDSRADLEWTVHYGEEIPQWLNERRKRRFDLTAGPLFRVSMLRVTGTRRMLMMQMHHIVSDGWSMGILLRELERGYTTLCEGRPDIQEAPKLQYADYTEWQEKWLASPAAHRQEEYWRARLENEPPVVRHPMSRQVSAEPARPAAVHLFGLPDDDMARLSRLCAESHATLYMGLQAILNVLLRRYTGVDDIAVGTPVANRLRADFAQTVGLFINTVVIRTDLSGDPTFHELLDQVRESVLGAQDNQDIPFERVVELSSPGRDADTTPLFQVMFGMNHDDGTVHEWEGIEVVPVPSEPHTAKFDLLFDVYQSTEGFRGSIEYRSDLLDADTMALFAEHYVNLLHAMVAHPDVPVSRPDMLTEDEHRRWVPEPEPTESDSTLACHELFARWAKRRPDAIAVTDINGDKTYAEMDAAANRLAHHLVERGVGPGVMAGLSVGRTADLVVGVLGILKAGGCYVPLDPTYPWERLRFMVEDTGIDVLVVDGASASRWADFSGTIVDLAGDLVAIAAHSEHPPETATSDMDPAYVIYTSGSTGRPKGVPIPHRNIARLFTSTAHWFGFDSDDVWTLFHSYAFDFSVWELWGALSHGGRLVVVDYETSRNPARFHSLVRDQKVTVLNQTPSAFGQFIAADSKADADGHTLRYVVFGGEALDPSMLRPWCDRHGDSSPRLINMYGITETTVHVTYRPITRSDVESGRRSVIGTRIPDLRLYVLDNHGSPVPTGGLGELYVGGAGLASGYLRRPRLTAERFVPNPFAPDTSDRLYRTGDLVRILPNGELEYRGRVDSQVELRGFRVEPGEIEQVLHEDSRVSGAAVMLRRTTDKRPYLAAYTTGTVAAVDIEEDLRRHTATRLPEYMVPSTFTSLESFPLTANGKLDRAALPDPMVEGQPSRGHVAPRTEVERRLTEIWSRALDAASVGIDDNYFALGGDSIRSLPLLAAAREKGLEFSLVDLLRCQTIRELAERVTLTRPEERETLPPFSLLTDSDREALPESLEDAYPMTRLQMGMMFHSAQTTDATGPYHNTSDYLLRTQPAEEAWRTATTTLCHRHEILRTSFALHGYTEPTQLVWRAVHVPLTYEDLCDLDESEREARVAARRDYEATEPFAYDKAPLIRFHVQQLTEETARLFITEHHAILDGWSERTLFAELLRRYADAIAGRTADTDDRLGTRFVSYVASERRALADEEMPTYWKNRLEDASLSDLPRLPGGTESSGMRLHHAVLPTQVHKRVIATADALGVPLRIVLLASHLHVVGVLCGTEDVVTGVVYNGRLEEHDADKALGLFLNTLPLRAELNGTWRELIEQTAKLDAENQRRRRYPLSEIIRVTGRSPLFESFFNYTHFHVEKSVSALSEVEVLDERGTADTNFSFGAEFAVDSCSGDLGLGLRYDSERFSKTQIDTMRRQYVAALTELASQPDAARDPGALVLPEQRELLAKWNATGRTYDRTHVLHRLVSEQVDRTPDAVAVRFEGEWMTYRSLDSRANDVAVALRGCGVGSGDFVAVMLERSLDLPAVLLGVLKAGAAYVPIDPEHPDRRSRDILDDAGIRTVIAEGPRTGRFASSDVDVLAIDEIAPSTTAPSIDVRPDDAAYMIFTSGSTGKPKGVVVSHRAICNRLLWHQDEYDLHPGEAVLHKTPITFDVSAWELFWPLITGGVEVVARPNGHRDPVYLARLIQTQGITTTHFVPSMLQAFLDEPLSRACTGLTRVLCSGEALPVDLQRRFFEVLPRTRLHNLYGPTEAAVDVTSWECAPGAAVVPIGRPVANTATHVLDRQGRQVPIGVTGELHISGIQLAQGYHRRPDLTDAAFVTRVDPMGARVRMYRTGDLARWLPSGELEYRGRLDSQVKVRGFRIELGEIEAVLGDHADVAECAVLLVGERLVAYVVLQAGRGVDAASEYAKSRLPSYMVPSSWVEMDSMPLTENGKLDRRRLPAPEPASRDVEIAPSDTYEARLHDIWAELLDTKAFGVREDFFQLGGHSLIAVRLIARINAEFDRELGVSVVLERRTIAAQAELLRERPAHGWARAVAIRSGRGRPLFLVHPIGGDVLCYRDFATAVHEDRPVYVLPAPGLSSGDTPLRSVEELAAHHLATVREIHEGPYLLGGWSFGGMIAYEMAHRLRASGETVELLSMIDSGYPGTVAVVDDIVAFADDTLRSAGMTMDDDLRRGLVSHGLDTLSDKLSVRSDVAIERSALKRRFDVYRAHREATRNYDPPVYSEPIHFHESDAGRDVRAAQQWAERAGGHFTVTRIPGGHYDLMRPPYCSSIVDTLFTAEEI